MVVVLCGPKSQTGKVILCEMRYTLVGGEVTLSWDVQLPLVATSLLIKFTILLDHFSMRI